jgi:hypothetical protein
MFGENITPLLILLAATHVAAGMLIVSGLRGLRRSPERTEKPVSADGLNDVITA